MARRFCCFNCPASQSLEDPNEIALRELRQQSKARNQDDQVSGPSHFLPIRLDGSIQNMNDLPYRPPSASYVQPRPQTDAVAGPSNRRTVLLDGNGVDVSQIPSRSATVTCEIEEPDLAAESPPRKDKEQPGASSTPFKSPLKRQGGIRENPTTSPSKRLQEMSTYDDFVRDMRGCMESSADDLYKHPYQVEDVGRELAVRYLVETAGDPQLFKELTVRPMVHQMLNFKYIKRSLDWKILDTNKIIGQSGADYLHKLVDITFLQADLPLHFGAETFAILKDHILRAYVQRGEDCMAVIFHAVKDYGVFLKQSQYSAQKRLELYKAVKDAVYDACVVYKPQIEKYLPCWKQDYKGEAAGGSKIDTVYPFEEIAGEIAVHFMANQINEPELIDLLSKNSETTENYGKFHDIVASLPKHVGKAFAILGHRDINRFIDEMKEIVDQSSQHVLTFDEKLHDFVENKILRPHLSKGWDCIILLFFAVREFVKVIMASNHEYWWVRRLLNSVRDAVWICLQVYTPTVERFLVSWDQFPY